MLNTDSQTDDLSSPFVSGTSEDSQNNFSDWPDPTPLDDALESAPHFDAALLPEPLRAYCQDHAARLNVPLEFVAAPMLAVVGAMLGRRVGVRLKRQDDWTTYPNIWVSIIGPPSVGKTPTLNAVMQPLRARAKIAWNEFEQADAERKANRAMIEASIAGAKGKAKHKNSDTSVIQSELVSLLGELQSLQEGAPKRYEVNDATDAKLALLLAENPQGLLLTRDELTGFLESLDKENFSRSLYLELWGGDAHHSIDRKDGGTTRLEGAALSICGGIQPTKLQRYVADSFALGSSDGFLARFLSVWPDDFGAYKFTDQAPNQNAKDAVTKIFEFLDMTDPTAWGAEQPNPDRPAFFRMEQAAYKVYREFITEAMVNTKRDGFGDAADEFTGKLNKTFGAIALITHSVMVGHGTTKPGPITEQAALMAALWCEFFQGHWHKVLSLAKRASPAALLAQRIEAGSVTDGMTVRDLIRKGWSGLGTNERVVRALEDLEALGWLAIETLETEGRPKDVIRVNPKVKLVKKGGEAQ